ncbi:MAG TPA: hypothetical protein VM123_19485 [archaeon]|nr:hypothetical protein [archaeon]
MKSENRALFFLPLLILSCSNPEVEKKETASPIRFGTYIGTASDETTNLLHIYSPWNSSQHLTVNFPEHCWGVNLPNVSHSSTVKIPEPWSFNEDSTEAFFEHIPRQGVLFRAEARAESMGVRLSIKITNNSDTPISDIRVLVCVRPDQMTAFRDTEYARTYVAVEGKPLKLGIETHYSGALPERLPPCWALNVKGGPDNLTFQDLGWFRDGPGRIVQERAYPPLTAIQSREDPDRWIATIWNPARLLFANPFIPCFHSDPLVPDCPHGETTRTEGLIIFHEGTYASLLERARRELGL